jgi:hypothetical protein
MLLAWLQHSLLTPTTAPSSPGLSYRTFSEMLALSDVGRLLTVLPLKEGGGSARAGAPFELPYTLAFPDLQRDQWSYHEDLLQTARAQLDALGAELSGIEEKVRGSLRASIQSAEAFVQAHSGDTRPPTP